MVYCGSVDRRSGWRSVSGPAFSARACARVRVRQLLERLVWLRKAQSLCLGTCVCMYVCEYVYEFVSVCVCGNVCA